MMGSRAVMANSATPKRLLCTAMAMMRYLKNTPNQAT
jgi:hypothetical protein